MVHLKFLGKIKWIFFIFLIQSLLRHSFTFTCDSPKKPLFLELAISQKDKICSLIPPDTKYRLQEGGSIICPPSSDGIVSPTDDEPISQALCYITYEDNGRIALHLDSTDCPSEETILPLELAQSNFDYICNDLIADLDPYLVIRIDGGASFRNWGHSGTDCDINPSEAGGMGDILCMRAPLLIEIVPTDESTCPVQCDTCTSSKCLSCSSEYPFLYDGNCLSECSPGTFESGSTCEGNSFL